MSDILLIISLKLILLFSFLLLLKKWYKNSNGMYSIIVYWILGLFFIFYLSFQIIEWLLNIFLFKENSLLRDEESLGSLSSLISLILYFVIGFTYFKRKKKKTKKENNIINPNNEKLKENDFSSDKFTKISTRKNYYILGVSLILIIVLITIGKSKNERSILNEDNFLQKDGTNYEKSYKQQKKEKDIGFTENLDSILNIYSNYKYEVSFNGPDNWKSDMGVSEHTIYRTYELDSGLTFSINVIEPKLSDNFKSRKISIWEVYDNNPLDYKNRHKQMLENQTNSKIRNFNLVKIYLKNEPSLRVYFEDTRRDIDYEYDVVNIVYSTFRNNYTYTFSLGVPKIFYDNNSDYYHKLFYGIHFLKKGYSESKK